MPALLLVAKRFGNHFKLHIALWRKQGLQSFSNTIASGSPTVEKTRPKMTFEQGAKIHLQEPRG
jgi:hypothetical protein